MDQHTVNKILSPCTPAGMTAGTDSGNVFSLCSGDAGLAPYETDPWYSLGFGLSSVFFSPSPSGVCCCR